MADIDKVGELVAARVSALQGTSATLVARAIDDIARLGADPRLAELLEAMKGGAGWTERVRAWEELHDMSPATPGWTEALRGTLHTADGWGRIFAAEILAWHRLCQDEAVPVLVATLQTTLALGRLEWARVACGAIGRLGPLSRHLTAMALPPLLDALDAGDTDVTIYAAEALGAWGTRARTALVRLAGVLDRGEGVVREHLLASLQKIDPSIRTGPDALLAALYEPDPRLRTEAARALFVRRRLPCETVDRLTVLVRDEEPAVRKFLALSLGNFPSCPGEVVRDLERMADDEDATVRLAASHAAVRLDVQVSHHLKLLERALESADRAIRLFGAWALGEVGSVDGWRARTALRRTLEDERDEGVRTVIREALTALAVEES